MPRRRKPGPRTKSGRLSRAHKSVARDRGTAENQARRHALINGSDPQLAATASGILLANGFLTQAQHVAALRYARLHALVYGNVWTVRCPLGWDLPSHGSEPRGGLLAWAERRIVELNAVLDPAQRQAVANVAVFGFVPQWFYTVRLKLRPLPQDDRDRAALQSGLEVLAGVPGANPS
jgi:hypothetical protein